MSSRAGGRAGDCEQEPGSGGGGGGAVGGGGGAGIGRLDDACSFDSGGLGGGDMRGLGGSQMAPGRLVGRRLGSGSRGGCREAHGRLS